MTAWYYLIGLNNPCLFKMTTNKTHIYFISGLAANSTIFENLTFPEKQYKLHYLNWLIPTDTNETLSHYAKRLSSHINTPNPIIIGVSFGGIVAQEIAKQLPVKHLIIISSVKQQSEFPKLFLNLKKTKAYKILPTRLLENDYFLSLFLKLCFSKKAVKRTELLKKYLSVTDKAYINWSIEHLLNWKQEKPIANIIHIHGSKDEVFPIENIKNCIVIKNATHAMILTKSKEITAIILDVIS